MHLPQSSRAGWSAQAKSPAGAVQSAQWRELDLSSSRAPAESPVVMRYARRLSELRSSSVSGGTADGEKDHEGSAPSNSAAGESHLHLGKQVCRLYKIFWCRCFAAAAILRRNADRVIHEIFPSEQEKTRCALPYLQRVRITCTSIKQGR